MNYKDIIKAIKQKDFSPVYFLHGEESYFIDQVVEYAEKNILEEGERSFNQVVLYGKETIFITIMFICVRKELCLIYG